MLKNIFISLFVIFSFVFSTHANIAEQPLSQREDVKAFMNKMIEKHYFNRSQLEQWFNQAKIQPDILTSIAKPAEKLPWHRYGSLLITQNRIDNGVNFWRENAASLQKAEKEYGVPAEIIVAILGIESFYGQHKGKHNVFDALVTLGFNYPPRSKFFLSELEQYLLLSREEQWDPNQIKGSYAGALGKPQFIASSYRRFAVDFNQNGKRDLINSVDDAIGSVANYFKLHGWQQGGPVIFKATAKGDQFKKAIASKANPNPEYSLNQLTKLGVQPGIKLNTKKYANQQFALVALQGKNYPEYWLGANNFYVITRYNHSDHYAMAVYLLSQEVKEKYKQEG